MPTSSWCETSTPSLEEAKKFAEAVHKKFPAEYLGLQLLAVIQLEKESDDATIAKFQTELARWATIPFITLAGFPFPQLACSTSPAPIKENA